MGFIMHGYINLQLKVLSLLLICLLSVVAPARAQDDYMAVIRQVNVRLTTDKQYVLNADIEYRLSPAAKEALFKGIALSWQIPVIIEQQRRYWWNKAVRRIVLRYQIQYLALLNVYRVKADYTGQVNNFASLSAALNAMSTIYDLSLIDKAQLTDRQHYQVSLKVFFEREVLPIPLRPAAYFDTQWALSSHWLSCAL